MSSHTAADPIPTTTDDPETITYGAVHLDVVDAERSLAFWRDLLGLAELSRSDEVVELGVDGRSLVVLHPGARRGPLRGHAGLYHLAIHLPNEEEFARVLARLAAARVPQAPTDHVFSKATYLSDPDGIQLELTLETPERMSEIEVGPASLVIRDSDGRVRGMTEPLDVDEVLSHLSDGELDRPLPSGTKVGHVHLHVSDLEAARRFYRDVIGFHEHTFVPGIGFADLGAGGRFPHRSRSTSGRERARSSRRQAPPAFVLRARRRGRRGAAASSSVSTVRPRHTTSMPADSRPTTRGQRAPPQRAPRVSTPLEGVGMDVTIIGTGNMARGIGTRVVAGGHSLTLLGVERAKAEVLAGELGGGARGGAARRPDRERRRRARALVPDLAPGRRALRLAARRQGRRRHLEPARSRDLRAHLSGRRLGSRGGCGRRAGREGRQGVQHHVRRDACVPGDVSGQQLDVLLASDDEDAKRTVARIVESAGLRAIDAGPLRRARQLEALGYLHIAVQDGLGTGYGSAVKFLGR